MTTLIKTAAAVIGLMFVGLLLPPAASAQTDDPPPPEPCDPDSATCETPAEPPDEDGTSITDVIIGSAVGVVPGGGEVIGASGEAVEVVTELPGEIAGAVIEETNRKIAEQAAESYNEFRENLAESTSYQNTLEDNPLIGPFRGLQGYIALGAIALVFFTAILRGINRIVDASGPLLQFLIVGAWGVTITLGLIALSDAFIVSSVAADLSGEVVAEEAGLLEAMFAPMVLGIITVIFEMRHPILVILAALWGLAAAASIWPRLSGFAPVVALYIVVNLIWPIVAILFVVKAYTALPSIGASIGWMFLVIASPFGFNMLVPVVLATGGPKK